MTDTINYLRRCADNKVLEASLTPEQCREIVCWRDIAERALLRLRSERAQCRLQSESAAALHADLQIERECTSVLRDKLESVRLAERERCLAATGELRRRLRGSARQLAVELEMRIHRGA